MRDVRRHGYLVPSLAGTLCGCLLLISPWIVVASERRSGIPPLLARDSEIKDNSLVGGACEPLSSKLESKTPHLEVRRIVPSAGRVVTRGTLLVASVGYSVPNYKGDTYSLWAQFDTTKPGVTSGGRFAAKFEVLSCGPSGIFSYVLPLEHVWRNQNIKHPLRLRFFLVDGSRKPALVIAASEIVEYASAPVMSPNNRMQRSGSP